MIFREYDGVRLHDEDPNTSPVWRASYEVSQYLKTRHTIEFPLRKAQALIRHLLENSIDCQKLDPRNLKAMAEFAREKELAQTESRRKRRAGSPARSNR